MVAGSSYSDRVMHEAIMRRFFKFIKTYHPHPHVHVFGDQLRCHQNADLIIEGLQNDIFLWQLPKNTRHFIKPQDDVASMKKKYLKT